MYTISIKFDKPLNGSTKHLWVSKTLRGIKNQKKLLDEQGLTIVSWRLHDGNGWCSGSENAWVDHQQIVGLSATICI